MRKKRTFVFCIAWAAAAASMMAAPESREEISAPAFGAENTISWRSTISDDANLSARPVSIEGKSEEGGPTALTVRFGDRTIEAYRLGNLFERVIHQLGIGEAMHAIIGGHELDEVLAARATRAGAFLDAAVPQ